MMGLFLKSMLFLICLQDIPEKSAKSVQEDMETWYSEEDMSEEREFSF